MSEKERELLLSWFVAEEMRLADLLHQLQNNIRFRKFDSLDCLELMLAQQHYDDFKDFVRVCSALLHLDR